MGLRAEELRRRDRDALPCPLVVKVLTLAAMATLFYTCANIRRAVDPPSPYAPQGLRAHTQTLLGAHAQQRRRPHGHEAVVTRADTQELQLEQQQDGGAEAGVGGRAAQEGGCRRSQCEEGFYEGRWVHRPNRTREEFAYLQGDAFGCPEVDFRRLHPERTMHMMHNQWDFEPSDPCCTLHQFSRDRLCRVLNGLGIRSVMVVGDSISLLLAQSLFLMAREKGLPDWRTGPFHSSICTGGEWEPVRFSYVRNDLLYTEDRQLDAWPDPPPGVDLGYDAWRTSRPWAKAVKEQDVDLLLLNAGAHVHHPELHTQVIDRLVAALPDIYPPDRRLFYRTTVPGHPGCGAYFNKGPEPDEGHVWDYDASEKVRKFSWQHFDSYNRYAVPKLQALGARIIHADRMLRLRADGHAGPGGDADCLHYWLPGPPDWLTVGLYNQLEAEFLERCRREGRDPGFEPVAIDDALP